VQISLNRHTRIEHPRALSSMRGPFGDAIADRVMGSLPDYTFEN
jgi:hypothetical protein